ncbi:MAG: SDR family NAD(P)-dependent oxidoreductase [Pirellulales bacterium]
MGTTLSKKLAIVTGASSGIGRAITLALAEYEPDLVLLARNIERLEEVASLARSRGASSAVTSSTDLQDLASITYLTEELRKKHKHARLLVHCGGGYARAKMGDASLDDLDRLYRTNVRGPLALTQAMLPLLIEGAGDIVFINSSLSHRATADTGQYGATQRALNAIAETLRQEVNPLGVRVMNIYPGRTATPLQEHIFSHEGLSYRPERLLQPEDIASIVVHSVLLPRTAEVTDVHVRPRQGDD